MNEPFTVRMLRKNYFFLLVLLSFNASGQQPAKIGQVKTITHKDADIFGTQSAYIENVGQYGEKIEAYPYMGKILFAYEELGMPVLFTKNGLIHLHKKSRNFSYDEISKREKRRWEKTERKMEEAEENVKVITMEWVNANPNVQIIATDISAAYHTYGLLQSKAKAYKKITYKNIYPGIDIEYSFLSGKKAGFEYTIVAMPGADISLVKMKYGGDVKKIQQDNNGNFIVHSSVDGISQSSPVAYYKEEKTNKIEETAVTFLVNKNVISFKLSNQPNKEKSLVIDPFITNTNSLTGFNTSKAKDVDFDYAGNIYVSGGGDATIQKLAKYDQNGVLLWTFTGSLAAPLWNFGTSYGGWVVEKTTGRVYLGQGISGSGFSVVRLSSMGVYDNYVTTPNVNFGENWNMIYSCQNGTANIMIAGGGGSANNELALLAPPSLTPATSNLSGLSGGHNDISDVVIDPLTNELYTIYSTSVTSSGADNIIYKHTLPYSAATKLWSVPAKFFALHEPANRPYLTGLDNSSNTLAVNSNFLFYWDGKNLKAINKSTGADAGTALTIPANTMLWQGGIYADECNNIFIGSKNGTIKVYKFDGNLFDDDAAADITVTGFSANSVYDLAYDNSKQLLYASGDGFVASFDISTYCPSTIYTVSVIPDCQNLKAITSMVPVPPAGTTLTYALYNGTTLITTNANGIFSNLTNNTTYTVKVFLNQACGGTQAVTTFAMTDPPVLIVNNPPTICVPKTTDLTNAAIISGSSSGLSYTFWKDANATIPYSTPSNAVPGTYYIKAKAVSACVAITPVTVNAFPVPVADAGNDVSVCSGVDVRLSGSGGVAYSWTPVSRLDDPAAKNPLLKTPPSGINIYHLKVTDINGCESQVDAQVSISVSPVPKLFIGNDTIISMNEPFQLKAIDVNNSGFNDYTWSPAYGLDNARIYNPVATLDKDVNYIVTALTPDNCIARSIIHIKVYKGPEIYVPSAFTPDNNGTNDVLYAIPVGLKKFNYFRIYNRYGQLVFTTSDYKKGWDAKINGEKQGSNVFVWVAEGIDVKGNIVRRKGTTTVIR